MAKDNVDLICDIGELAGLFEKSHSLHDFLHSAVSIVAYHMRAAVCSIYLYERKRKELVLTATQGLSREALGEVKLQYGEGITGSALKELRPICEGHGSRNPNFKYIQGIQEEQYEAFLAVPILRGLTRIGVLVVQDPEPYYFDDNDIKALKAIAAQLATVIENAKLLLDLHEVEKKAMGGEQASELREEEEEERIDELKFVKGSSASDGIVQGEAVILSGSEYDVLMAPADDDDIDTEKCLEQFNRAVNETESQLQELQQQMELKLADVASLIFSSHLLILRDTEFTGSMAKWVGKGRSPERAISNVVNDYIHLFSKSSNSRLQEKVLDLKDLGHRLLMNLDPEGEEHANYEGQIIIAAELLPSDILKFVAQKVEGIIIVHGSVTSHISILARSLQLPLIFVEDTGLLAIADGTHLLIDANQGTVFVNPDEVILEKYKGHAAKKTVEEIAETVDEETFTRDGTKISLLSNINLLSDLEFAVAFKSEGVGLYRSEFPFIVRNEFPSEEAQFQIYRKIISSMDGKEVVLRTLDVGGDKKLPYYNHSDEANPFLGLRAIRFSLSNMPVFKQQLRAMLRAGHESKLKIMFPFISSIDDFLAAKDVVAECIQNLRDEGIPHNANPKIGPMIELPAAVAIIEELALESDFLCIGTNDLIQYMLAVDRTNEKVSNMYISHHPAVLRSLYRIADTAIRNNVELSLCGDMALDEQMLPFLLGIGIRKFSMDPRSLPVAQERISKIHTEKAMQKSRQMLRFGKLSEVNDFLEENFPKQS